MRKLATATILSLSTLIVSAPAQAHHNHDLDMSRKKYGAIMPDAYYDILGTCETGLPGTRRPNWDHSTRNYTGGLGIHRQTFRRWSKYHSAKGLTPRQQIRVADAIAFSSYVTKHGELVWRVGPWGWACLKQTKILQRYICISRHPKVQKWKRGC